MKQKGDKKIDDFDNNVGGFHADIYLRVKGRGSVVYVADLLEKEFIEPDLNILRQKLRDYSNHWLRMEWHPVIKIEVEGFGGALDVLEEVGGKAEMNVELERFLLSRSPAGTMYECPWDVDESHRKARMTERRGEYDSVRITGLPIGAPLKLSEGRTRLYSRSEESEVFLLDYTPQIWARLVGIVDGLNRLRIEVRRLTATKQGLIALVQGTAEPLSIEDARPVKGRVRK